MLSAPVRVAVLRGASAGSSALQYGQAAVSDLMTRKGLGNCGNC